MKRISPATVTFAVVTILLGLVAAYSVKRYLAPSAGPRTATAMIVVPRVNLPKFARIREIDVEVLEVPKSRVPAGAVTVASQALYRLCRETVMAGQPILESNLYEVGAAPTLAEQLPPGYRAVTITVDRDNAVDGLVMPESVVDVSLTVQGDHPELEGVATVTLMRKVKVLATSFERFKGEERLNVPIRSVTLSVTPEQANKLILAQRYGSLSVTLRGMVEDDLHLTAASKSDNDNLVNPSDLIKLSPRVDAQKFVRKAQIWRGTSVEEVEFTDSQVQEANAAGGVVDDATAGEPIVPNFAPTAAIRPTGMFAPVSGRSR
ncbi:MAG: Flp pilus assembly protein CpaB [Pirellulales bacterium]|nr:Flp pilus assembly protein CpaB [Pirellulales bacterium]